MSASETGKRRHPNVVHLSEAKERIATKGSRFGYTAKVLGFEAGARGIGASWYEVPPGRSAFPAHYHCANEEAMFVLEGEGKVRIGDQEVPIGAGDWVTFPTGPESAHRVTNTGEGPLRYLALSTLERAEVVGYPDSKKVGAMAAPPGWKFGDPPWIRVITRMGEQVDYYDGEEVD